MKLNRKVITFIICSILVLPFSVYVGYYLNSMLISNIKITFELTEILKSLTNTKILSLVVCIQALFMMLFFLLIFTSKYGIYKANTEMITTNISIPKHYGQGNMEQADLQQVKNLVKLILS